MNAQPLPDRWTERDRPVLMALARQIDNDGPDNVHMGDVADQTGLPGEDAERSLRLLEQSGYLEVLRGPMMMSGDQSVHAVDLTERGRRTVGLWPSGEGIDALVDALHQAEEATDDPEEKTLLRRAAGAVGSVSRDIMVDVMGAVIARQSGIG